MAIITDIVKTNKNKGQLYELFLDNESIGYYHLQVIIKNNLKVGKEVDIQKIKDALIESSTLLAMEKTLNMISKTMKTQKEIETYLKEKGYIDEVIKNVVAKLFEYNYINDEIYSKYYISNQEKKYGNKKIKFELTKKGVNEKIINNLIDEHIEDIEVIKNFADKYMKNRIFDYKTKGKLFNHLASKGFEFENINRVLNEYSWSGNNENWV